MKVMVEPSIDPAPGLVVPAAPDSGRKSQFVLFDDGWIHLQGYMAAALELPVDKDGFETKYGSVGTSTVIPECIAVMKAVNGAAALFGNPRTLRAALTQDPHLLASDEPPHEIYTHAIWLGQRVHVTAARIASGYESVLKDLPGLSAKEQVLQLRAYLFDETLGPVPLSDRMSRDTRALIRKVKAFEQKMNEYNDKLRAYTKGTSTMVAEVNASIGTLAQRIKDLQDARDAAYRAYLDFTIAAYMAPIPCILIGAILAPFTLGISFGIGSAVAVTLWGSFSVAAARSHDDYNTYCAEIESESVQLRRKQRLRSDLADFDLQAGRVAPAIADLLGNLEGIDSAWVRMKADMLAINQSVDPSNVASMPFLIKAKAGAAIDAWKDVDQAAKSFTAESLIDYASLAFGEKMPQKMPIAA